MKNTGIIITLSIVVLVLGAFFGVPACKNFSRDQAKKDAESEGQAELLKAESSKKVAVESARANLESAKLNAQADVIRANGIAQANQIIGNSLKNNRAYLEWLWIDNIEKNPNSVFYIPTENKVPIFNFASRADSTKLK